MAFKFRFACHLITWGGEQNRDPEKVLSEVAFAGYEGVEGLSIGSPEQLVQMATLAAKYDLHIVNAGGPSAVEGINYNVTLGNRSAEVPACSRAKFGGPDPKDEDFQRTADL